MQEIRGDIENLNNELTLDYPYGEMPVLLESWRRYVGEESVLLRHRISREDLAWRAVWSAEASWCDYINEDHLEIMKACCL